MNTELISEQFDIVPTHLAVQAMRDNGYKNAAYAIAELMDNGIQARATVVELLCAEKTGFVEQRSRTRVEQIAVLDNGSGMDAETLRIAMQFGNGTHLAAHEQNGIGKFGMGLPASSVSQCTRVDVWTWQDGPESSIHTYLDIDEIKKRLQTTVPMPLSNPIPALWRNVGSEFGISGTLVVWSHLDRCTWRTSAAIINNSEELIGRIYRRFIDDKQVKILLTWFNTDKPKPKFTRAALPNDPGYLMARTSCPAPFDRKPMFEPWGGEDYERTYPIEHEGQTYAVKVRYSVAKDEARRGDNQGNTKPGRHAWDNVGVSIVRADRELEMDQGFIKPSEPTERWWGVELDFPPALDDIFGVTNNKQSARNFTDLSRMDFSRGAKDEKRKDYHEVLEEYHLNDDPHADLLPIVNDIRTRLGDLRQYLKDQKRGLRTPDAPTDLLTDNVEAVATVRARQRQEEGHESQSDRDELLPEPERQSQTEKALVDMGLPIEIAHQQAHAMVANGVKYKFDEANIDTTAFFSVMPSGGGALILRLNTGHPAYKNLIEVLQEGTSGASPDDLRDRLNEARDGLRTLLIAWARYEDEQSTPGLRDRVKAAREHWGQVARDFLDDD